MFEGYVVPKSCSDVLFKIAEAADNQEAAQMFEGYIVPKSRSDTPFKMVKTIENWRAFGLFSNKTDLNRTASCFVVTSYRLSKASYSFLLKRQNVADIIHVLNFPSEYLTSLGIRELLDCGNSKSAAERVDILFCKAGIMFRFYSVISAYLVVLLSSFGNRTAASSQTEHIQ